MIGSNLEDLICDHMFFDISRYLSGRQNSVYLKIEAFNPAGSIKIKTARYLLDEALKRSGESISGVIESSSGNLGIALAMLCAARGIHFECVVDVNALEAKLALMRYFNAAVTVITEPDANGGYLGSRIEYIKRKVEKTPGLVWTNQYANKANILAHYQLTATAIHEEFPALDYLFVGTGTTGTLFGCTSFFSHHAPETKIVAIDSAGSVTFGDKAGERFVPGIGTSQRPPIADSGSPSPAAILHVAESEGGAVCRRFSKQTGLLIGGSTGSVIAGFERYASEHQLRDATVVLISPDLGNAYLSTVYNDAWVQAHFSILE
ncbi:2,3-diaminopropionate biosynthesis protein SbnA [Herbaspirillum camelliae]|uniref:2,3-diaminopropionate biosynthesis protein SbnA n=1 Tax=Herbaspirillum camelliae TaxID=1892903 RepID=UPI000949F550|nr:2,3-diaminopropionate biosynthesis protein SbnA [Herbaspirillum camelliae]